MSGSLGVSTRAFANSALFSQRAYLRNRAKSPGYVSGSRRSTSNEYIGSDATIANEVSSDKSFATVGGINQPL